MIKCKCPASHPIGIKRDTDFPDCSFLMHENCAMRTTDAACLPSGAIGVGIVRYAPPDAARSRKGYEGDCIVLRLGRVTLRHRKKRRMINLSLLTRIRRLRRCWKSPFQSALSGRHAAGSNLTILSRHNMRGKDLLLH